MRKMLKPKNFTLAYSFVSGSESRMPTPYLDAWAEVLQDHNNPRANDVMSFINQVAIRSQDLGVDSGCTYSLQNEKFCFPKIGQRDHDDDEEEVVRNRKRISMPSSTTLMEKLMHSAIWFAIYLVVAVFCELSGVSDLTSMIAIVAAFLSAYYVSITNIFYFTM